MAKWIKNILGIVIVLFLLWYLSRHWDKIKALLRLSPTELVIIYLITFLSILNGSYIVQCLLNTLKVRTFFWDMVLLHNATYLLNYVPMKFGTVFRANYLKRRYGLSYAHFGTFFVYLTLLMAAAASAVGLVVLVTVYGLAGYETKVLSAAFLGILVLSIFFAFIPLPIPTGSDKWSTAIRSFLTGRHQVSHNKFALLVSLAFLAVNFIIASVRLGIIYKSMGQSVHPAGFLVLGALAYVTMFVNLTPGSLGMRELVLGAGAVVLGISPEVGILAAMIDRAIALSWSFVIGGGCAAWLLRKSPADFREAKSQAADEKSLASQ